MFLELATRINQQEQNTTELKGTDASNSSNNLENVKGVSFTRWGYSGCPEMTELVYSGRMVNILSNAIPHCFPLNPTYPSELDRIQRQDLMQKTDEGNYSIPCAVCYSSRHSTVIMQPAKHTCTNGWSAMYTGLLVANKASLLCMDNVLQESRIKTINRYHYVKASCDLLPCPPYDDKSNLTCTVCIK